MNTKYFACFICNSTWRRPVLETWRRESTSSFGVLIFNRIYIRIGRCY